MCKSLTGINIDAPFEFKRRVLFLEGKYGIHDKKALKNLIFSKTIQKNHTSLTLEACYDILSVKISVRAYNIFFS